VGPPALTLLLVSFLTQIVTERMVDLLATSSRHKRNSLASRFYRIDEVLDLFSSSSSNDSDTSEHAGRVLRNLGIKYQLQVARGCEKIPKGPSLILANHPTGLLEGFILADILEGMGANYQILANQFLEEIPALRHRIIGVDVLTENIHINSRALIRFSSHIKSGGTGVMFPAGDVAQFSLLRLSAREKQWDEIVGYFASLPAVQIFCVNIALRNSFLFHLAGIFSLRLRGTMYLREFINKKGVNCRVAMSPVSVANPPSSRDSFRRVSAKLRDDTLLLGASPH
jgi:hypothetical protein